MKKKHDYESVRLYFAGSVIFVGLIFFVFPHGREMCEDWRQHQILAQWQTASLESREVDEAGMPLQASDRTGAGRHLRTGGREISVLGVLKIPQIELEQPVLDGATDENLALALAAIEQTGVPGTLGNFAVAGHNSRTYGRHFNRLNELAVGDAIYMETEKEVYTYYVDEIFVADATAIEVLDSTADEAELTLITCYYQQGDGETKRLVVKGTLYR